MVLSLAIMMISMITIMMIVMMMMMMMMIILVKINNAPAKSGEGRDDDNAGNTFHKSRDEVAEKDYFMNNDFFKSIFHKSTNP